MQGDSAIEYPAQPGPANKLRTAVCADDQLILRRMAAALEEGGLGPVARGATAARAMSVGNPAQTVVAFACDVGRTESMASLRKFLKELRSARIIVVSPDNQGLNVRRALDTGAEGFVLDSEVEQALAGTVHAVAAGQLAVPRRLRRCVHRPALSHRERQVLGMLAVGLTNAEIAERLFLSESTVKSHLSSSFAKLGVKSRKEAASLVLNPDEGLHLNPSDADLAVSSPAGVPAASG